MNLPFGLLIEGVVALLLALTIGYCVVLNDKLKKLHADRDALKQMVTDLVQATDLANGAISALRQAAGEADDRLRGQLEEVDRVSAELSESVSAGRGVMDRIARVTQVVQTHDELVPPPVAEAPKPAGARQALDQLAELQKRRENAA
jgi:ABC-type transporter Mla subunit MlaD